MISLRIYANHFFLLLIVTESGQFQQKNKGCKVRKCRLKQASRWAIQESKVSRWKYVNNYFSTSPSSIKLCSFFVFYLFCVINLESQESTEGSVTWRPQICWSLRRKIWNQIIYFSSNYLLRKFSHKGVLSYNIYIVSFVLLNLSPDVLLFSV